MVDRTTPTGRPGPRRALSGGAGRARVVRGPAAPVRVVAAAVVAALVVGWGPDPTPVGAEPVVAAVAIVDADGRAIAGGGSDTAFTLELPGGAACPGDSANDNYRVNSYMVPSSVAPEEVTYDGLGPTPVGHETHEVFRQALFGVDTTPYVSAMTAEAEAPGEPGPIVNVPLFDMAVYGPGDVPPGRYGIGLACTLFNEISTIWGAEIVVRADPDDAPAAVAWEVVGQPDGATGDAPADGPGPAIWLGGAAAVALGGFSLLWHRRRRTPSTTSSEER